MDNEKIWHPLNIIVCLLINEQHCIVVMVRNLNNDIHLSRRMVVLRLRQVNDEI